MNTKKIILSGLVALGLAAVSANAQVLPGSDVGGVNNPGDLVLGFQNTTQSSDIAFDIGQFTAYEGVAAGTYTVAGFNATDLTNAFGTNATNGGFGTATKWTVFGGSGSEGLTVPDNTLWIAASAVPGRAASGTQAVQSGPFDTFVNSQLAGLGGVGGDSEVLNPKSFTNLGPATGYGAYTGVESSAAGTTSLALYELQPQTAAGQNGTLLGTFTLSQSTGLLTFTVGSAIPEPSTYAGILGVVTLGIVAIRRRRQASTSLAI